MMMMIQYGYSNGQRIQFFNNAPISQPVDQLERSARNTKKYQ